MQQHGQREETNCSRPKTQIASDLDLELILILTLILILILKAPVNNQLPPPTASRRCFVLSCFVLSCSHSRVGHEEPVEQPGADELAVLAVLYRQKTERLPAHESRAVAPQRQQLGYNIHRVHLQQQHRHKQTDVSVPCRTDSIVRVE